MVNIDIKRIISVRYSIAIVMSGLMLGACASKPQVEFDTQRMTSIKTIAIDVPKPTKYFAITAGGPIFVPIPGVGLLAAAVGGVIAGGTAAASTRTNKDFDDLVKSELGDTGLNRKYIDALKAELREQGYDVKEIDLGQDGMPKVSGDWLNPTLKGGAYAGADAILIAPVITGYGANGLGWPYVRSVSSRIRIFSAKTLDPIFSQNIYLPPPSNIGSNSGGIVNRQTGSNFSQDEKEVIPYVYPFYADLVKDLPHAIKGVDEALMSFVPQFRTAVLTSRGITQSASSSQK
ncbi:PepSY domain-containing protein [Burkholderia pyrrocinia]|uniref:PepSY domain-containing protein n=1 Tax=Burkholderia pyrrocinia TaxID=60550 RepID=UPI0015767368|nr:PepSY domain-containing protein [Burkholderia pyrrocinia]NTX25758.1 PepSY domain-containing protein [Burkholderia pyrrocinia]